MVNPEKYFTCARCQSPHNIWSEANDCCEEIKKEECFEDEPEEAWECGSCGDLKDTEDEAEECCKED